MTSNTYAKKLPGNYSKPYGSASIPKLIQFWVEESPLVLTLSWLITGSLLNLGRPTITRATIVSPQLASEVTDGPPRRN